VSSADDASRRVVDFWTRQHAREDLGTHDNFLSHPLVQGYLSLRAVGGLIGLLDALANQIRDRTRPGARFFSPGCGRADKELHLAAAFPDREFVGACSLCPYMKRVDLANIRQVLTAPRPDQVVEIEESVRARAERSLTRMLEIGASRD